MDTQDRLLIEVRQWIAHEVKEIGEIDLATAALLDRVDKYLLDKLGPRGMIDSFAMIVGYHGDAETNNKRQAWRREAAAAICQMVNDAAHEEDGD